MSKEIPILTWADLDRQAPDTTASFRDDYVELFLRFQGQLVDGRRLTETRFAQHYGIVPQVFGRWVKNTLSTNDSFVPNTEPTRGSAEPSNVVPLPTRPPAEPEVNLAPRAGATDWSRRVQEITVNIRMEELSDEEVLELQGAVEFLLDYCVGTLTLRGKEKGNGNN